MTHDRGNEPRFAFGANWLRFISHLDEARVRSAESSLQSALRTSTLDGRTFLDVGSGSGLFSLAASRLGAARVHSFDFDSESVECTRLLKARFAPQLETWTIEHGDVTDEHYCAALGAFDDVYCFGVLHHTGSMWQALDNVLGCVAPEGRVFVSIYNDQGRTSARWRRVKRLYHRLPTRLRPLFAAGVWGPFELREAAHGLVHGPRAYLGTWTNRDRGMSKWHDIVDWIGGYPFEVAKPERVLDGCHVRGFELTGLQTVNGSLACNEFLFVRHAEQPV